MSQHDKFVPISECEICSKLGETETSFYKYGSDDLTRRLPPEAARLTPLADLQTTDQQRHHGRRCPICGTFYQYDQSYEYLVNGSEDEEELTRLTPAEARKRLTDQEYDEIMEWMRVGLEHSSAMVRRYAAKCMVSHHLERHELTLIPQYLKHSDPEVVAGATAFLARLAGSNYKMDELLELKPVLAEVKAVLSCKSVLV